MHRFFSSVLARPGEAIALSREAARQSFRVLKLRPGESVALFDGSGREAIVDLETVTAGEVCGTVTVLHTPLRETSLSLELAVGLPRAEKWEWILQKGTELGVARFQPVETARCVARIGPADWNRKADRWRKIILEAVEQSGRTRIPDLLAPLTLSGLLQGPAGVVLHPVEEVPHLSRCLPDGAAELRVLIGPEGGLEEGEYRSACSAGWRGASLGPRILRCETAALAASTILLRLME